MADRLVYDPEGLNTGTHSVVTAGHFVTPVEHFFTRSHAPVPGVDPRTWRLEVGGLVQRPASFTLDQLESAFPRVSVTATLVCAGLRRAELLAAGPLPGELPWGLEPVSTGLWSGVALRDLLDRVGVAPGARHVEFVGLDQVERQGTRFGFGGSIDLAKALGEEVILATALNGEPLSPEHGFPLRSIVPGWIGARAVKWLGRISLRETPSDNYFQRQAYRIQREATISGSRDVSAGVPLSGVPLNAVILDPGADQPVSAGLVRMRGWAMGSEGRPLTGVEVSPNDGADWIPARISIPAGRWTWAFWEAELDLGTGTHTLVVRATGEGGATQPAAVAEAWNIKGYANNAWHRVTVVAQSRLSR